MRIDTRHANKAAGAATVNLSQETIDAMAYALADGIRRVFREDMPTYARLAAADTVHTMQRPATVFAHAIKEAADARAAMEKADLTDVADGLK